jgi:hypothetical protein
VADRFHVQQLFNDAMDDLRLEIRRQSLDEENALREKAEREGGKGRRGFRDAEI